VGAVILAGLASVLLARLPLPVRNGRLHLRRLTAPAEVRFDRRGTPHIRAATEEDAYRVLGWVHAGDRLFQMELRRRAASGRLSEIFGRTTLPIDEAARRNRHDDRAREELEALSPRARTLLACYAEGVNGYIASRPRPLEMVVLGIVPEPWTSLDSLSFERLMFSNLTESSALEDDRLSRILAYGVDPFLEVFDAGEGRPTLVPSAPPYSRGGQTLSRTPIGRLEGAAGSNAWALSGSRTASGRPLLANDPHLQAEMPAVWYAAHLSSRDGLDVAGLTLAGLPGIVIGHNGSVAWGITMQQADDADLFIERLDPPGRRYEWAGRLLPIEERSERIGLRGEAEIEVPVRATMHGPIVEELSGSDGASLALAKSWASDLALGSFEAFFLASRARDHQEIQKAWTHYGGPPINVCWASRDGHIGLKVAGSIPARPAGDGRLPVPGWTASYDWKGLVSSEDLPRYMDPAEGFVASANDDWTASGRALPYPGDYAGRERVDRIRQVLSSARAAQVPDMRELQSDVLSFYALRVQGALRRLTLRGPSAARAREILRDWDGRAQRRGAARLFYAFLSDLRRRVFLPHERRLGSTLPVTWELLARMIEGSAGNELWDDPATKERETREAVVAASLSLSLARIESEEGPVPADWSWAHVHTLSYQHPFTRRFGILRHFLDIGPVELPGEWHTVNVAGFSLQSGRFDVRHVPSARVIFDLDDPDLSRLVLPLGQSGQFQDVYDDDQTRAWADNRDFAFPFSAAAVDAASVAVLRLIP